MSDARAARMMLNAYVINRLNVPNSENGDNLEIFNIVIAFVVCFPQLFHFGSTGRSRDSM